MKESYFTWGETSIHPVALIFTIIMSILIFFLPRRYAIIPLLMFIFIPLQQKIVIATMDFTMLRIALLFGWIRILIKPKNYNIKLTLIDYLIIVWCILRIISYTMLWKTSGAFINRVGGAFDILGIYFLTRYLIINFKDIIDTIKILIIICIILATSMLIEFVSERNLFSIFGGVPEYTFVRDGRLRCQGAFAHPIMAGTFGASLFPLFVLLIYSRNYINKVFSIIGCFSSVLITLLSSSSGPLLTLISAVFGTSMWILHKNIKIVKWTFFISLFLLHLVMKAPVWALLERVKIFGASTGYHRFLLVDQFINRFGEWWLFGTKSTVHWGHESLQMWDVTNQFVRIGVDGGILTLICFILIIIYCFQTVGMAINKWNIIYIQRLYWAFGASMFAHIVSFMGVSYFHQIVILLYMTIAIFSLLSTSNIIIFQKQAEEKY